MRQALRWVALFAAVVCFVAALTYRVEVGTSGDRKTRRHEVGIQGSPWLTKTVQEESGKVVEWNTRVTLWNWSAAVAVLGLLSLGVRNLLEPDPERPAEPAPPEPGGAP